ncbi:TetR/AcrR family transcriptional regulator [Acetobacterium wieringae]|uniref:Biofilm operon icaADBC HTH-type negative transcriptional regulator IcaR n=1 Tax=Acetobacterium wieringae TaxID=52694 RepID=A0A1F2PC11_9FIRM|nr:TetR/AcrR family transcriptional regulator [Acetobacterium wieringae]OFV68960.1 biofilm operon icaADBC HTH-type negative transcriptional regulator IcaR [Acetobacterium wieringae]
MAIYKSGIKTRDKIIEACIQLFYEKGYNSTTYADICEKVGIQQGNLHYHFRSKDTICQEVLERHLNRNFEETRLFVTESNQDFLRHILSTYIFWYKYFNDAKYRRFAFETVMEYTASSLHEYYRTYLVSIGRESSLLDRNCELDLISCAAVESSLPKYMYTKYEEYSYEELASYNARVYGHYLGPDTKYLEEAITKAENIMHTIDLNLLTFSL